jgi:hypothetical protein
MNPEHKESAETKDQIIKRLFGIRVEAKDLTPMDKGECKIAMEEYAQLAVKEAREQDIKEMEALKARYQILRSLDATMKVRGIEECISIVKSKLEGGE